MRAINRSLPDQSQIYRAGKTTDAGLFGCTHFIQSVVPSLRVTPHITELPQDISTFSMRSTRATPW